MLSVKELQNLLNPIGGTVERVYFNNEPPGIRIQFIKRTPPQKPKFHLGNFLKDPKESCTAKDNRIWINETVVGQLVDTLITQPNLPDSLHLDLNLHHVDTEGAKHLARFIQSRNCPKHVNIDLSSALIDDEGVGYLTKALVNLPEDRHVTLNLQNNQKLSAPGVLLIEQACRGNERVKISYTVKNHAVLNFPEGAQFSVALCKDRDSGHNFLAFYATGNDGHCFNLMNVGLHSDQFDCGPDRGVHTGLYSEGGAAGKEFEYTYKAFDITREEYLTFVESVYPEIQNPNEFKVYLPTESGGDEFRFDYVQNKLPTIQRELNGSPIKAKLALNNTCRQVAQSAARKFLDMQDWGSGVYRKFFIPLPYRAKSVEQQDVLKASAFRSEFPLYSFPRPLKVDKEFAQQNKKLLGQLKKIMRRMEIIAKDNSELSRQKFAAWKALYVTLSPAQAQRTPQELLSELKQWMTSHEVLMTKHRKERRHQWFSTKSEKLVKQLQEEFQVPSIPGCQ
jgi:hypothetical protein